MHDTLQQPVFCLKEKEKKHTITTASDNTIIIQNYNKTNTNCNLTYNIELICHHSNFLVAKRDIEIKV